MWRKSVRKTLFQISLLTFVSELSNALLHQSGSCYLCLCAIWCWADCAQWIICNKTMTPCIIAIRVWDLLNAHWGWIMWQDLLGNMTFVSLPEHVLWWKIKGCPGNIRQQERASICMLIPRWCSLWSLLMVLGSHLLLFTTLTQVTADTQV